jgi:hypothetical protein
MLVARMATDQSAFIRTVGGEPATSMSLPAGSTAPWDIYVAIIVTRG